MSDERIVPCPACWNPQDGEYADKLWADHEARNTELKQLREKLDKVRYYLTLPDTRSSMQAVMALCEIDGIQAG